MASIEEVIGSYTPLERRGHEWQGVCPIESHAEPLAVIGDRFKCYGCGAEGDALAFLRAIGDPDPEGSLANGRLWTPTLTVPTPPKPRYGLHRALERPDATVLITDHRRAAKVAEALLPSYVAVAWPDGGDRWGDLEPLRGRTVLLWPSPEGLEAMLRLEAVITGPLNAGGKILTEGLNLADWTGTAAELIAWAKAHVRLLAPPKAAAQVAVSEAAGNVERETPPSDSPPPAAAALEITVGDFAIESDRYRPTGPRPVLGTNGSDLSPSEPSEPPTAEFPPEASTTRPKRPRRRLQVVGGAAVDALESIDPEAAPIPHELSESGIAAHFVALHKDRFRTVHEWSGRQGACWMAWDGSRWRREPSRVTAMQQAQLLAHGIKYWDAARGVAELSKVKFESRKFIGSFLDLASYAPDFLATPDMFDADPLLLGTPAGTLDLRNNKILEPEREHYITRQTSVAPEPGPHPLFDDLIRRASGGEADIAAYLWNWLGYLLTGLTKEKAFLYAHGKTDSGKTTLATAIANIMGNAEQGGYAAQCDIELFTDAKVDKGNDRLAHLAGARFAYASEMEEGKNFKTALLKLATGADALHGRFLYAEQFSFTATHKLWIFGNHQMHMKSSDKALLNRLHLLEYKDAFIVTPEERDNDFAEKLRAEYPAILHSMGKAGVIYLENGGLGRPERISAAVDEYANSEDTLGQWIAECLDVTPGARTAAREAYENFDRWAQKEGAFVPSAKRFGQQLVERGFERARPGGVRSFVGFTLKLGANL